MTRLFAAIAAVVIAGALATGVVYLVGAIAPLMLCPSGGTVTV